MKTAEARSVDDLPIFPIRTAARLTGVNPPRLRGWESQHGLIQPSRTRSGHRLFSRRDLELITHIKCLIDDEGMPPQSVRLLLQVVPAGDTSNAR